MGNNGLTGKREEARLDSNTLYMSVKMMDSKQGARLP